LKVPYRTYYGGYFLGVLNTLPREAKNCRSYRNPLGPSAARSGSTEWPYGAAARRGNTDPRTERPHRAPGCRLSLGRGLRGPPKGAQNAKTLSLVTKASALPPARPAGQAFGGLWGLSGPLGAGRRKARRGSADMAQGLFAAKGPSWGTRPYQI
jgi:hypothetical protein